MEETQKKGMSKGCLVALIIVGALLLIVVIGALSCWFYRVELARMGAGTMMNQVKQMVAENPPQDMDTAQFNSLVDGFVGRLEEDEIADKDTTLMKLATLMQVLQRVVEDKAVDQSEIDQLSNSMISFFERQEEAAGESAIESEGEPAVDYDWLLTEATHAAKQNLLVPSSAEFELIDESNIAHYNYEDPRIMEYRDLGEVYSVSGIVRSQNAFGAMVPSNYRVDILFTKEGKYEIVDVQIE